MLTDFPVKRLECPAIKNVVDMPYDIINSIKLFFEKLLNTPIEYRLVQIWPKAYGDVYQMKINFYNVKEKRCISSLMIPHPIYVGKVIYNTPDSPRIPYYLFGDAPIFFKNVTFKKKKVMLAAINNIFIYIDVTLPNLLCRSQGLNIPNITLFDLYVMNCKTLNEIEDFFDKYMHKFENIKTFTVLQSNIDNYKLNSDTFKQQADFNENIHTEGIAFIAFTKGFNFKRLAEIYRLITAKDTTIAGLYDESNEDGYSIVDLIKIFFDNFDIKNLNLKKAFNDLRFKIFKLHSRHLKKLFKNILTRNEAKSSSDIVLQTMKNSSYYILDTAVNPMGQLLNATKVTKVAPDSGLKEVAATDETRLLHPTYFGVLDPIDTSSGRKVALVHYLTPTVIVKKNGAIILNDVGQINRLPLIDIDVELGSIGLNIDEIQNDIFNENLSFDGGDEIDDE